jgi:hypothetical protein
VIVRPESTDGQDTAQADGQADSQAQDGQQTETAEKPVLSEPPASISPISTADAQEESTAGASQNALDYLTGRSIQTGASTDIHGQI